MKNPSSVAVLENTEQGQILKLPFGIVGFPDLKKVEILYREEEFPFLRMRAIGDCAIEFIVLEPYGLFSDYEVEINGEDLDSLGITSSEQIHLMNIVVLRDNKAEVNLMAPLVFNRDTLQGKQVVIANYKNYSAQHVLECTQ